MKIPGGQLKKIGGAAYLIHRVSFLKLSLMFLQTYCSLEPLALLHCTEVRFASFFSGGFITAIVVNSPERKLAKHNSVHCISSKYVFNTSYGPEHTISVCKYWKISFYPSNADTGTFYRGSADIDTDVQRCCTDRSYDLTI